jgi:hypothetical protein
VDNINVELKKNGVSEVVCCIYLAHVKVQLHDCSNGPLGTQEVGNFAIRRVTLRISWKTLQYNIDTAK